MLKSTLKLLTIMTFASSSTLSMAFTPSGKIECIVPANPGGGWDFTCRSAAFVMEKLGLIHGSMQTTNMAGGDGAVAYSHVISKRNSDDNLIIAASSATTTRLGQHQYTGMDAGMVKWIGALGADYGVIAVSQDSKYKDLNELIVAMKQDVRAVKFAGGSVAGGWDHLEILEVAKKAGISNVQNLPYLSYNSGGMAITQVMGGHADAVIGDISEVSAFVDSGNVRVLVVLADERLPGKFSNLPTAKEQGIDAIGANWRGFYMPAGASEEAQQFWVSTLDRLYDSPQWQEVMASHGLVPFHPADEQFNSFVINQVNNIEQLSKEIGLLK